MANENAILGVKVNKTLRDRFAGIAKSNGMNVSEAIRGYMAAVVLKNSIMPWLERKKVEEEALTSGN